VPRRADAGYIRLTPRDGDGLTLLADMYAAPYDLLAARFSVRPDIARGIIARWRTAGLAATGKLSEGPMWCWLTPAGMRQVGHPWTATEPPLARLAHIRAVLATRLWLESTGQWKTGRASWRSERDIRADRPGVGQPGHVPDGEITWPDIPGSPRSGETWAVETELTAKTHARVQRIISGLLAEQYAMIMYVCAPATLPIVREAARSFRSDQAARITVYELPPAALMPKRAA
jgi:hypothetical protein